MPGGASEHVQSRFNLVDNAIRLEDAECVNIWAATGVSEQLFIAFVVHLVKFVGGDPTRIALVECEMMNGRRIIGLGELNEAQMRAAPAPKPMSDSVAHQYLNAWAALTSPESTVWASTGPTHRVLDVDLNGARLGELDNTGVVVDRLDPARPQLVTALVEVKNTREWIYADNDGLMRFLAKAAYVQAARVDQRILPVFICRQVQITAWRLGAARVPASDS